MAWRRVGGLLVGALGLCVAWIATAAGAQGKATLEGRVTDLIGGDVPSAVIMLYSPDEILETHSRGDGTFRFEGLQPGRYTIEIHSPGFKRTVFEGYEVTQQLAKPLVVELQVASATEDCGRLSTISYVKDNTDPRNLAGVVAGAQSSPIRGVRIAISRLDDPAVVAKQTTDEKGAYQFTLPPGRYVLRASREGYSEQTSAPFSIARKALTRVNIHLVKSDLIIICQ